MLGLLLAVAFAFVLENLTDTVRSPELLSERFGVAALGTLFMWNSRDVESNDLILWSVPDSGYAEALRQIRANVQFATAKRPSKIFLVTSPEPSEGKTTIASNLAIAMAQTGKRVALVDADLRRPRQGRGCGSCPELIWDDVGLGKGCFSPGLPSMVRPDPKGLPRARVTAATRAPGRGPGRFRHRRRAPRGLGRVQVRRFVLCIVSTFGTADGELRSDN